MGRSGSSRSGGGRGGGGNYSRSGSSSSSSSSSRSGGSSSSSSSGGGNGGRLLLELIELVYLLLKKYGEKKREEAIAEVEATEAEYKEMCALSPTFDDVLHLLHELNDKEASYRLKEKISKVVMILTGVAFFISAYMLSSYIELVPLIVVLASQIAAPIEYVVYVNMKTQRFRYECKASMLSQIYLGELEARSSQSTE